MKLVAADRAHIPFLAANMRADDVTECAAFGRAPEAALQHGLGASLWALTAIVDGEPHAMMGVAPASMIEGRGVPWMLGTERVYRHGRDLARHTPSILGEMMATFPRLENLVSVANARAIRYLRHAGFELSDAPVMIGGTAFILFSKEAP